jgi:hypothetical protein
MHRVCAAADSRARDVTTGLRRLALSHEAQRRMRPDRLTATAVSTYPSRLFGLQSQALPAAQACGKGGLQLRRNNRDIARDRKGDRMGRGPFDSCNVSLPSRRLKRVAPSQASRLLARAPCRRHRGAAAEALRITWRPWIASVRLFSQDSGGTTSSTPAPPPFSMRGCGPKLTCPLRAIRGER